VADLTARCFECGDEEPMDGEKLPRGWKYRCSSGGVDEQLQDSRTFGPMCPDCLQEREFNK
jgi:hypothetical protein